MARPCSCPAICAIAFGIRPHAFNAGHGGQELEKRIAADLIEAAPALFLDNVNGAVLRSDTLATVITERPAPRTGIWRA
jgi:hypothetical protein